MTDASFEKEFGNVSASAVPRPKLTKTGKVLLGIAGASFIGMCAVTVPFILPAARRVCLPYVPATDAQVNNVMSLLRGYKPGRLVDLGSGDGRIIIEAAKHGFQATGVELNPWLVLYSRLRTLRLLNVGSSCRGSAVFLVRDLWKHRLSCYDHVVIFGVDSMMPELHNKLMHEMRVDCCVIACRFPLPCEPSQTVGEGLDTVWLYKHSDIILQSTVSANHRDTARIPQQS